MNFAQYQIDSELAMDQFGRALAECLPSKSVVALVGTLGAGKTRLVRALAEAWHVPREEIGSPTFVLCREYLGTRRAYHLDAYRLTDESELLDLGFEELLAAEATTLLEWADRVAGCLPPNYLQIEITPIAEGSRLVMLTEFGQEQGVIKNLRWPSISEATGAP